MQPYGLRGVVLCLALIWAAVPLTDALRFEKPPSSVLTELSGSWELPATSLVSIQPHFKELAYQANLLCKNANCKSKKTMKGNKCTGVVLCKKCPATATSQAGFCGYLPPSSDFSMLFEAGLETEQNAGTEEPSPLDLEVAELLRALRSSIEEKINEKRGIKHLEPKENSVSQERMPESRKTPAADTTTPKQPVGRSCNNRRLKKMAPRAPRGEQYATTSVLELKKAWDTQDLRISKSVTHAPDSVLSSCYRETNGIIAVRITVSIKKRENKQSQASSGRKVAYMKTVRAADSVASSGPLWKRLLPRQRHKEKKSQTPYLEFYFTNPTGDLCKEPILLHEMLEIDQIFTFTKQLLLPLSSLENNLIDFFRSNFGARRHCGDEACKPFEEEFSSCVSVSCVKGEDDELEQANRVDAMNRIQAEREHAAPLGETPLSLV